MSAKTQIEKEIIEAYTFLRNNNFTVPSETLQFMLDSSLEKLEQSNLFAVGWRRGQLCDVSNCTNPKLKGSDLCVQHKFIGE